MNSGKGMLVIGMAFGLLACSGGSSGTSGEPSGAQIEKALERAVGQQPAALSPVIHGTKKLSCEEHDEGYMCRVEVDVTPAGGQRMVKEYDVGLWKEGGSWVTDGAVF